MCCDQGRQDGLLENTYGSFPRLQRARAIEDTNTPSSNAVACGAQDYSLGNCG